MATPTNRYSFHPESLPTNAILVALKICELCRCSFTTDTDEARHPGDYINLQRGAGRRTAIVCGSCKKNGTPHTYFLKQAQIMQDIATTIRKERALSIERDLRATIAAAQGRSSIRQAAMYEARDRDNEREHRERHRKARESYQHWKIRLMELFKEKTILSAREICTCMKYSPSYPAQAVCVARRVIPQIVLSHSDHDGHRVINYYTISSILDQKIEDLREEFREGSD